MLKKNKFIELVLVNSASLLLILVVVSAAAFLIKGAKEKIDKPDNGGLPETRNSAPLLPKSGEVALPKILYNLSGIIIKIEGNTVIFDAEINRKDENGQIVKSLESRKAVISAATKLSKFSFIGGVPTEEKLVMADFKPGNYIEVISDRDISKALEFSATQLRIFQ